MSEQHKEKVIIAGTAGQGKTTIVEGLRERGQYAHDGDFYATHDAEGHWNWGEEVNNILDDPSVERSFVAGYAANIEEFASKATKLIVLHTSRETLRHRLETRANNPYGKDPVEREKTLEHNRYFFDRMMRLGGIAVSTELDLDVTLDQILDITGGRDPEASWTPEQNH